MTEIKCSQCGKSFSQRNKNHRYCSESCQHSVYKARNESGHETLLGKSDVGTLSELIAAADLMERGYFVFRALSSAAPFDLLAVKEGRSVRVEVRTASKQNGKFYCPKYARDVGRSDVYAAVFRGQVQYVPDGVIT